MFFYSCDWNSHKTREFFGLNIHHAGCFVQNVSKMPATYMKFVQWTRTFTVAIYTISPCAIVVDFMFHEVSGMAKTQEDRPISFITHCIHFVLE